MHCIELELPKSSSFLFKNQDSPNEGSLEISLREIQREYADIDLTCAKDPNSENIKILFASEDTSRCIQAFNEIFIRIPLELSPPDANELFTSATIEKSSARLRDILTNQNDNIRLPALIRKSFQIIAQAFEKFGSEKISISFNGGKDCTVLAHLLYFYRRFNFEKMQKIPALYVRPGNVFKQADNFTFKSSDLYELDIVECKPPIRSALKDFMEQMKCEPGELGILMGSRRSDPYCNKLKDFSPTDSGWPEVIRVNPILDWSYKDIWEYIDTFQVYYCELYDRGYTSIGTIDNTLPNPNLKDKSKNCGFKQARELGDDSGYHERLGRLGS